MRIDQDICMCGLHTFLSIDVVQVIGRILYHTLTNWAEVSSLPQNMDDQVICQKHKEKIIHNHHRSENIKQTCKAAYLALCYQWTCLIRRKNYITVIKII